MNIPSFFVLIAEKNKILVRQPKWYFCAIMTDLINIFPEGMGEGMILSDTSIRCNVEISETQCGPVNKIEIWCA